MGLKLHRRRFKAAAIAGSQAFDSGRRRGPFDRSPCVRATSRRALAPRFLLTSRREAFAFDDGFAAAGFVELRA
jgi:hypothetical protein